MFPIRKKIITGTITATKDDEPQSIDKDKLTIKITGKDAEYAKVNLDDFPKYTVQGYFGDANNSRNYNLDFEYNSYKIVHENFTINNTSKSQNILLENLTKRGEREEDLINMTGFGCSELMPKYLVGASCEENSKLEGDATDLALWIQKFGGMITTLISMIAVALIVWNAFNIVTAAGDTEKIEQGKKGIIWVVLGLAVIMFAYIIIKTVIALTYTQ